MAVLALTGCAVTNNPINKPRANGKNAPIADVDSNKLVDDSLFIALAFSGGGMRASAFSYGMLEALKASGRSKSNPDGLLPHVRLVTGVSGGSVTAAYFGYRGPAAMNGYRETYLIQDAEKYMANSPINPITLVRGFSGGANGRKTFGRFLDESLFHGATFGDLARQSDIITWINAADVANKTSFLFSPETYDAMVLTLEKWHGEVVDFRCSLPPSEVKKLRGTLKGWDCENLKMFVSEVSFEGLPKDMREGLNQIPTRLKLETDQVDLAIEAGRMATLQNPEFRGFLRSLEGGGSATPPTGATRITPVSN